MINSGWYKAINLQIDLLAGCLNTMIPNNVIAISFVVKYVP